MASLLQRALRFVGRAATDALDNELRRHTRSGSQKRTSSRRTDRPTPSPASARTTPGTGRSAGARGHSGAGNSDEAHAEVGVWDVASRGLPSFSFAPDPDGEADPGEVVWTWVPYEEDTTKGKDRPVLVLARHDGRLVTAQLTSKDHDRDAAQEARWGRYWHDVGTGAWDRQGRPSEVRLDRLLLVSPGAVRREGATMDRSTFDGVVAALRGHWA